MECNYTTIIFLLLLALASWGLSIYWAEKYTKLQIKYKKLKEKNGIKKR